MWWAGVADGYHLLQSVFVLIDWCDSLHFERRDDGRLLRHDLGAALPADDLCLRAARALQTSSPVPGSGADISIDKQVPWGAGLGGGSSDAATTLLALNRLWGLHWPRAAPARAGRDAGCRRALLHRRTQRLRRRHRRAADADAGAGAAVCRASSPTPRSPPRRSSAARTWSATTDAVILAGSFAGTEQAGPKRSRSAGSAATTCSRWRRSAVRRCRRWPSGWSMRFGNSRMSGSGSAVFARVGTDDQPGGTAGGRLPAGWVAGCAAVWTTTHCGVGPTEDRFQGRGASRVLCRGVAKLVKASDFDSDMRGFESFLPCQIHRLTSSR